MDNDLICRSALLDEIYGDNRPNFYDGADIANWQMHCINCAPAIDAEPVRRGKWKYQCYPTIWYGSGGPPEFVCSVCEDRSNDTYSYCPNCGAKMDSETGVEGE